MPTILQHIERSTTGAPTQQELDHDIAAKNHFLKYCDYNKCHRQLIGLTRGENWDEGTCRGCFYNPYIMQVQTHILQSNAQEETA